MLKTIINCWSTINNQKQMIFKRFGEIVLCYFYLTNKCKISSAVLWVKIIKRIDFRIIFHLKCTIVLCVIKHRHSIWFTMLKQSGVRFFFFFCQGSLCFSLVLNNRSFKDKNPMTFFKGHLEPWAKCNSSYWWISTHSYWRRKVYGK